MKVQIMVKYLPLRKNSTSVTGVSYFIIDDNIRFINDND
jgi:hypothetical protein